MAFVCLFLSVCPSLPLHSLLPSLPLFLPPLFLFPFAPGFLLVFFCFFLVHVGSAFLLSFVLFLSFSFFFILIIFLTFFFYFLFPCFFFYFHGFFFFLPQNPSLLLYTSFSMFLLVLLFSLFFGLFFFLWLRSLSISSARGYSSQHRYLAFFFILSRYVVPSCCLATVTLPSLDTSLFSSFSSLLFYCFSVPFASGYSSSLCIIFPPS